MFLMNRAGWWRGPGRRAWQYRRGRAVSSETGAPSRAWTWLGLTVAETGEGTAVVEMTPTEDMAKQSGFVHGGMISTLADSARGRSVRTLKPGVARAMSFDLKLSFIGAAQIGEKLRATGRVVHAGRGTVLTQCSMEGEDGRVVAPAA